MVTVQNRSGYTISFKKKVNTNKESKRQPPKGHCQAETSALQYTPHDTDTAGKQGAGREEGQEGGENPRRMIARNCGTAKEGGYREAGKSTRDQHMSKNQTIL